jgi:hypothetical protein
LLAAAQHGCAGLHAPDGRQARSPLDATQRLGTELAARRGPAAVSFPAVPPREHAQPFSKRQPQHGGPACIDQFACRGNQRNQLDLRRHRLERTVAALCRSVPVFGRKQAPSRRVPFQSGRRARTTGGDHAPIRSRTVYSGAGTAGLNSPHVRRVSPRQSLHRAGGHQSLDEQRSCTTRDARGENRSPCAGSRLSCRWRTAGGSHRPVQLAMSHRTVLFRDRHLFTVLDVSAG